MEGERRKVDHSDNPRKMIPGSTWSAIVIVMFSVAIVIIGSYFFLLNGWDFGSSHDNYAEISISVQNRVTPNPLIQLSVDDNGDGIFEQVTNCTTTSTYENGIFYQEIPFTTTIKLNSSATIFYYRILVLEGTTTMYNVTNQWMAVPTHPIHYDYPITDETDEFGIIISIRVIRS